MDSGVFFSRMKNKYLFYTLHIIVILVALLAWNFDRPIFSEQYNFIRTLLTALGTGFFPYLFLGWTKKTRSIAVYVCLVWTALFLVMKMGLQNA